MQSWIEIFIWVLVGGITMFIGFVGWVVGFVTRVMSLLSYSQFRTPCEITLQYKKEHGSFFSYESLLELVKGFLKTGEEKRLVVGRESSGNCRCEREYCLSFHIRRRRRHVPQQPIGWAVPQTT